MILGKNHIWKRLIAAGALVAFAAPILGAWAYQNRFVFEPDLVLHAKPADFPFPVIKRTFPANAADTSSETLEGWWILSTRRHPKVILYFHGNDGNLSTTIGDVATLRSLQHFIFMIDYRGFGQSRGAFPTDKTVYEDAEAAWTYVTQRLAFAPSDIYICGHSLGGAIAIELAVRHPEAAGLIVESSFTSIYDMAMLRKPFSLLPLRALLNQRFDSLTKVPLLKMPVLYVHGTEDEIVPLYMGKDLYAASGGRKRFLAIKGAHHDDIAKVGGDAFLEGFRSLIGDSADPR
jgi:pimeloyl-ACP methyl ester carboxylesterase